MGIRRERKAFGELPSRAAAVAVAIAVPALLAALPQEPPPGAPSRSAAFPAYNVTLVTDNAPDFTDLESYLQSITSQHAAPQEKAVAVWRWSQRLRKQTSYPTEEGHAVLDPILFFTSYGYTMCGIISGIDNALWLNLGWKARYVQLGDHTVCECSWDDGKTWHMFDNSMSFYCFNDAGAVASTAEIEKNPRFYLQNFAPELGTNPVKGPDDPQGWRSASDRPVEFQRTLANGWDSFRPPNDLIEDHLAAQWGRTYAIQLRPHEHYTRHFAKLDAGKPDPRYYRPLRGADPDALHRNIRANGVWRYAPDLRAPDARAHVYSESGVTWTGEGARGPGGVTFKVSAANVVTSAKLSLRAEGASASVSRDAGVTWGRVPLSGGEAELVESVAGAAEYLVRVDLEDGRALLSSLVIETVTQLNRPALPRLTRGVNRVQLRLGRQVETITLAPSLVEGNHRKAVHEERSVEVNDKPYFNVATLRPAAGASPASVTWRVRAPTPVVGAAYGGNVCVKSNQDAVALLHSWDGKTFVEDFRKADASLPYDRMVLVAASPGAPGARDAYFRYQFETAETAGKWRAPGLQTALMTVHHEPRVTGFTPIEATYCWVEHRADGDVERRHTEVVTSQGHEYVIHVAGYRDPTMKWVRLNLKGFGPEGASVRAGYGDGKDVGPGAEAPRARYLWGKNLARGRPYTCRGAQDPRNPDAGGDLTDGIIAPPEDYVSVKWMPTNVFFAPDASPAVTIDLGTAQEISAVRVHAGQEGGFRLGYPDLMTAETSPDGTTFTKAGQAEHTQVFDPPADYAPWELDDSGQFAALPAGGRLAYAFRILLPKPVRARFVRVSCAARKGWGVLLSEIQVFDRVTVDRNVPPAVVLPKLRGSR